MRVVVCGARGFVGRHLVASLLASGHEVLGGSRVPERARQAHPELGWVELDVDRPDTLDRAFEGADAVVYLVHQMRSHHDDLEQSEIRSAENVVRAADRAGVKRLVYLGGPAPLDGAPSAHLAARLRTGEVLRSGVVSTIELRAGMVVGPGSESWLIVRDLAMRLPVMILPRWLESKSQPIWIDDVVAALAHALSMPQEGSRWYDLPGPEVLSGRQILQRVAKVAGLRPMMLGVPVLSPSLSSHWIRLVTRADYGVARQLVDGLTSDLIARDEGFWSAAPSLVRTPFDEAVRQALAAEDRASLGRLGYGIERVVRRLAWS